MMILSSPASSTRRNAGSEAVKVLKTHLPKVINGLLCEPTVDDVLDHMRRALREVCVDALGAFSFHYEGLPRAQRILGVSSPGMFSKHVYKGDFHDGPVVRHCGRV